MFPARFRDLAAERLMLTLVSRAEQGLDTPQDAEHEDRLPIRPP